MTSTQDPALEVPELPESIPELGAAVPALAAFGVAASQAFVAEGEHGFAQGVTDGHIETVALSGQVVARDVHRPGTRAVNYVASPGLVRREMAGPQGTFIETTLVAPNLPLVAVQWSKGEAATDGPGIVLRVPVASTQASFHVASGVVVLHDAGFVTAVGLKGGEGMWSVDAGGTDEVILTHPGGARVETLVVASGTADKVHSAFKAAAHLTAHAVRAVSRPSDALDVRSGVEEIDDGIAWAASRLRAGLSGPRMKNASEEARSAFAFWAGLGALAIGDAESASSAVAALTSTPDAATSDTAALRTAASDPVANGHWPTTVLADLLAGRIALATGDTRSATRHAGRRLDGRPSETSTNPQLGKIALASLADALRYAESPDRIEAIRSLATSTVRRSTGRSLPMAGNTAHDVGFLGGSLEAQAPAPPTGDDTLDRLLAAWALFPTDPDSAWVAWRSILGSGLAKGPAGAGTWDAVTAQSGIGAPIAGTLVSALVYGMLGYKPDAPSGRARLAPTLPGHINTFEVGGLALGDSRIGFRYEKSGSTHRFELEPTIARVPPVVILAPSLEGTGLRSARVDGAEAVLDAVTSEPRVRAHIQVPLDGHRNVELVVE